MANEIFYKPLTPSLRNDSRFNGFTKGVIGNKIPSDITLKGKKKEDLIELLHIAQRNYDVLMFFYQNAINANMEKWKAQKAYEQEIRNKAIDELSCKLITYFADCQLIEGNAIVRDTLDGVIEMICKISEQMTEEYDG